jgi:hypothetical protein
MPVLVCFLCCQGLQQRTSKRGKPYFVCDACGIQIFVRRKQGIEKLEAFFANLAETGLQFQQHPQHFGEMQAVLKEIAEVQREIEGIGLSHIFSLEKSRIRDALLNRKENLLLQLEALGDQGQGKANPEGVRK